MTKKIKYQKEVAFINYDYEYEFNGIAFQEFKRYAKHKNTILLVPIKGSEFYINLN